MGFIQQLRKIKHRFHTDSGPECFPVDAWTDPTYEEWFLRNRATRKELDNQKSATFSYKPKFSIIVPLFQTPIDYLTMMVESVLAQTYSNFELLLVNASPENVELAASVDAIVEFDERVKQVLLDGNYGITENTNHGIDVATGDFMCFMDHDDFIEPDLLFEYARALNDDDTIDVLYCDEDLVEVHDGKIRYVHPLFKPQYSPEFLLCKNYIIHLLAIRATIVRSVDRPDSSFDGTQDYNMVLQASKQSRRVHGVQKVLYHWRIGEQSTATNPDAKPYSQRAYRKSAFARIEDEFPSGRIVSSGITNIHNVWICDDKAPKVSIIVDCADSSEGMCAFLEMMAQSNCYPCAEIVGVSQSSRLLDDNDAGEFDLKRVVASSGNRFERLNAASSETSGDYLLFLEADDVLSTPQFIEQMVGLCSSSEIGVMAAKGLYSDGSVKSYGIAVTPERVMPLYRGYPDEFPAYQCNMRAFQNLSAVSWHGMMVPKELFQQVGGFDASYEGEIGSADFCQKVLRAGLRVVQTPTAKVQTAERPPEKRYDCFENSKDFTKRDLELFDANWPGVRSAGDPYFNRNFDQSSEYFQIAGTKHIKR